jgi:dihydropteroate synthase
MMLRLDYLAGLYQDHQAALQHRVRTFNIGDRSFDFDVQPAIMGVINLSPDSWYRESVCLSTEQAIQRGLLLAAQGATIVDIGAESTLAQAARAEAELQNSRLLPAIRALSEKGILVSAETYLPAVAKASLEAGAKIINLTGPENANGIYEMAAEFSAAVIVCYVEGAHVRAVDDFDLSADPIPRMREFFAHEVERAQKAGVTRLFLDPGLGFYYRNLQDSSVRIRHQMATFLNTFRLRELGWPVCHALPHAFEFFREEVRSAEGFFAMLAALGRTDLFRTHEVPRVRAVLETLNSFQPPA